MRIVCEQCQTKYIVPDEKIVKNVLRLTCQKCGHVITTRVEEIPSEEKSQGTLGKWRATSLNTPKRAQGEAPSWYYSHNGESFGPFTETELNDRFASESMADIARHCYVWRKSFSQWKPAIEVEPFASTILMPPPPPPPAPIAPPSSAENLPPLFNTRGASTVSSSSVRRSPSDIQGLKHRLQLNTSASEMPERQRLSLSRLASESIGLIPSGTTRDQDVPTHPAFPAIEDVAASSSDSEKEEDTTRVGAVSPFFSFQSLDAISRDIHTEDKSASALPKMSKPFPTTSGLPAISSGKSVSPISAFGSASNPTPGISSIFGQSPSAVPKTDSAAPSASSSAIPRFNNLHAIATRSLTSGQQFNAASTLSASGADKDEAPELLADFREDLGDILKSSEPSAPHDPSAERDQSVSQWLPSQSALPSTADDISLGDISQNIIDPESANKEIPSLELEGINLDRDNSSIGSTDALGALDDAQNITGQPESAQDDAISLDSLNLDVPSACMEALDSALIPNIDMEASENSQLPDTAEPTADSMPENLGDAQDKPSADDSIPPMDLDEPSQIIPEEIDLDESSQIFTAEQIEESLATDANDDAPKRSNIIQSTDALFANDGGNEAVARVSHSKLEDIAARRAALIAEIQAAQTPEDEDSRIGEESQLIQLNHFVQMERKEKRHKTLRTCLIIAGVLLLCGIIAVIIETQTSQESVKISDAGEFDQVQGRAISSDELDRLIPEDEFELVDIPTPQKSRSHRGRAEKSAAAAIANTQDNQESDSAQESATQNAMDALYGKQDTQEPSALPQVRIREDGRADVVLQRADAFANTQAVQGSKYQGMNAAAPSARDKFAIGLKSVSQTVQECHRREAKTGNMNIPKIYIQLTVQPEGLVDRFSIEPNIPETFIKCLDAKKDRWKFAPFDGNAVTMRQAFILN